MGISNCDQSVYDRFEREISFQSGKYEVRLPWKEFHMPLPSNYNLCLNRLTGLLRRLKGNPDILKEYGSIIREQLKQKIVEVILESMIHLSFIIWPIMRSLEGTSPQPRFESYMMHLRSLQDHHLMSACMQDPSLVRVSWTSFLGSAFTELHSYQT